VVSEPYLVTYCIGDAAARGLRAAILACQARPAKLVTRLTAAFSLRARALDPNSPPEARPTTSFRNAATFDSAFCVPLQFFFL
jgi:hypothetical protein